ncbi:hydrophobic protein [Streptomyces pluripotens]|uniref:Hydrophobic protein n=1 Tax=Streptomyces pluripotens TaxID=1355015 RepID=A0A221P6L9_9ACTN|nr:MULTISPECIES: hypothetical protein [Streptomyces]ARP73175.1 hydrophobic protein [Streptomyces pluripotens]ASN27425.1 hydrophobic protein [Streptomyces pluripotens]KIE28606.1 hydrophobic protein [Streptomyces sp. MUSC 125]MCH0558050.1 hydrophobic protein [Streptomyces sp. MUM 16J]
MTAILLVLLVALILVGVGFVVKMIWWIALAVLIVWLLGFLVRGLIGSDDRNRGRRW